MVWGFESVHGLEALCFGVCMLVDVGAFATLDRVCGAHYSKSMYCRGYMATLFQ